MSKKVEKPDLDFSRTAAEEGFMQLFAGVGFIDSSMLLRWELATSRFVMGMPTDFEAKWHAFDRAFGRAAFWNIFSTGAECLLKAFYLCHNVEIRDIKPQMVMPEDGQVLPWVEKLRSEGAATGNEVERYWGVTYGTLGDLQQEGSPVFIALQNAVFAAHKPSPGDLKAGEDSIWAAYKLLTSNIRNRDTHAYVPNVRDNHYFLLEALMLPAFNQILEWLPPVAGTTLPQKVTAEWGDEEGSGKSFFTNGKQPTFQIDQKKV